MALLRLLYSALLRGVATLGGAVTAYGATGMFTSGGVMPPNALVVAGISAVPYSLYALSSFGTTECPQPHPPLTPTYTCAPVGTHALAIVSPLIALLGLALMLLDLRALAGSLRGHAASL